MSAHVLVLLEALPYPLDVRARGQVAALTAAGHAVTVVSPTGHGYDRHEETLSGVRVRRFAAPAPGAGPLGYVREYGLSWLRARRLVREVARRRAVDLVFVCNPPDFLVRLTRPLARRGAAVLLDLREISPELFEAKFGRRGLLHRLLLRMERSAVRRADAVTTVSASCAELVCRRTGIDPRRVFLVGNGPDPERIFPVAPRPELRRGRERLVVWLGAMSAQEGLEGLVDVAERIVRGYGRDDVHVAIVGHGDAQAAIGRAVDERGLGERVELTGPVDDDLVRAYLSTADVCLNVDTRNEMNDRAAMRKVLEYLAMGRPVVQFPLGEMQRLCGDAAVYARDGDTADMAARVVELLDDEPRRRRLGEAGARRMWEGLMWPQQVPALLAAVELALRRPAAAPRWREVGRTFTRRRLTDAPRRT